MLLLLQIMPKFHLPIAILIVATLLTSSKVAAHESIFQNHLPQHNRRSSSSEDARSEKPPEFQLGTTGVCRLYSLSGYLALDSQGEMVPLREYCQQRRNWVWYEPDQFWQTFREVASAETISFTQTLDQDQVEAYAESICPFLEDGGTLQELAEIRSDAQLPIDFEQALAVAAIKTYCRQYRSQSLD